MCEPPFANGRSCQAEHREASYPCPGDETPDTGEPGEAAQDGQQHRQPQVIAVQFPGASSSSGSRGLLAVAGQGTQQFVQKSHYLIGGVANRNLLCGCGMMTHGEQSFRDDELSEKIVLHSSCLCKRDPPLVPSFPRGSPI